MSLEKNIKIAQFIGMQLTSIGWFDSEGVLLQIDSNDNTFDEYDLKFDKSWDWISSVMGVLMLQHNRDDADFSILCGEISNSIIENDLARGYESLNLFIDKVMVL
jgi:hypothetical protein